MGTLLNIQYMVFTLIVIYFRSPPKKAAEATEAVNAVEATETVEKCPDLENQQHKPQPNNSNEQFEDKISSGPQFSKSQPCSPIPTKRQLNRQAKLAEHEAEEMANSGDCYSSTEYVQYATAATKNPYENGGSFNSYVLSLTRN